MMEPMCDECDNRVSRCICNGRDPGPEDTLTSDLKIAINSVLWMQMPPETTLARAEEIALDLMEAVLPVVEARIDAKRPAV